MVHFGGWEKNGIIFFSGDGEMDIQAILKSQTNQNKNILYNRSLSEFRSWFCHNRMLANGIEITSRALAHLLNPTKIR
jgi:hypothetical protein